MLSSMRPSLDFFLRGRFAGAASVALAWAVTLVGAFASPLFAKPELVTDLSSESSHLEVGASTFNVTGNGVSYFNASDAQQGSELWRTDGTAAGTYRLTDVCPGACDSAASPVAFLHGTLYFTADDGENGVALWRTDGQPGHETTAGVVCVADCLSTVLAALYSPLAVWRDSVWWVSSASGPPTLWKTDFTAGGTKTVELCADLGVCQTGEVSVGNVLPGDSGLFLWMTPLAADGQLLMMRTDGTRAGTVLLRRFPRFGVRNPVSLNGRPAFFFSGTDLWVTDGTPAGTRLVKSFPELESESFFLDFADQVEVNGIWFAVLSDGTLMRSDGTAAGTAILLEFPDFFEQTALAQIGSEVLYLTPSGVYKLHPKGRTIEPIAGWSSSGLSSVVALRGRVFVLLTGPGGRLELWSTDGTPEGTGPVPIEAGAPYDEESLSSFAGGLWLTRGEDELWSVSPDAKRSSLLHAYQPANGGSLTVGSIVLKDELLFFGLGPKNTLALYRSDGTADGTRPVTLQGSLESVSFSPLRWTTDFALFAGGTKVLFNNDGSLWVTDGSDAGTLNLNGSDLFLFPVAFSSVAPLGDSLIFAGQESLGLEACNLGDNEPWITDGTPAHTQQILDLNPYFYDGGGSQCSGIPFWSAPGHGVALGPEVVFAADDLVYGRELFATNGTAAGTHLVADINTKTVPNRETDPPHNPPRLGQDSDPDNLTSFKNQVVFFADDGITGDQLFASDGTTAGTHRVSSLDPAPAPLSLHDLVLLDGAIYFIGPSGAGDGLFTSDGTSAGTHLVSDLTERGKGTRAQHLTVAGHHLFFVGFNVTTGTELWTSEGTAGTTHLVADLRPGARGSQPQNLTAVGEVVVFAADDGVSGLELWRSDGTVSGTYLLDDIAGGGDSSNPGPFQIVGSNLLFGADDGVHGRELWRIPVSEVEGFKAP
jgi:ELWxxDGT repeat protein